MRFSRLLLFVGCAGLLGACASSHTPATRTPRGFWRPNRFDRDGKAQGRWRTYYDSADAQPFTTGRYRHGRPVRTFRYYAPTGRLDYSEQYRRQGFCEVTYWHPGGQVARSGHAQWVTGNGQAPRFYWFGPWTNYAENGQVAGIQTYTNGTLTRAETYAGGQLTKAENYKNQRLTTIELFENGKLLKTETYENNVRVGSVAP